MTDKRLIQFPNELLTENQASDVDLYQDSVELLTQNDAGRMVDLYQDSVELLTENARGVDLQQFLIEVLWYEELPFIPIDDVNLPPFVEVPPPVFEVGGDVVGAPIPVHICGPHCPYHVQSGFFADDSRGTIAFYEEADFPACEPALPEVPVVEPLPPAPPVPPVVPPVVIPPDPVPVIVPEPVGNIVYLELVGDAYRPIIELTTTKLINGSGGSYVPSEDASTPDAILLYDGVEITLETP